MRQRVLYQSIYRLLPDHETVYGAVVVWTITARSVLVATGCAAIFCLVFSIVTTLSSSAVDGARLIFWSVLVAAAVGALLTRFRVVALTKNGYVLFAGSSVRNVATGLIERLPDGVEPEKLGGNLATSDWLIDGETYTVSKRGEKELERLKSR